MKDYEVWRNEFGALSNTFVRLASPNKRWGRYRIYDFHTGVNGNCWIQYHEADLDENGRRGGGYNGQPEFVYLPARGIHRKEYGNQKYKDLLAEGFVKVGKFEEDIFGRERRV